MCFILEGLIPADDLAALEKLGDNWLSEIVYFPVFHPNNAEFLERYGYSGKPVKVSLRIEVLEVEEEPEGEKAEEDLLGASDQTQRPPVLMKEEEES